MSTDRRFASVERGSLAVAWAVAAVATAGSLNYSLGLGLFPCRLCWYQRILMYPLVIVLGVMVLSKRVDPPPWRYVLPFTIPGTAIAGYHSYLQVSPSSTCSFVGCASVQYRLFGLLTIPNQSLLAFSLVTLVVGGLLVRSLVAGGSERDERTATERPRPNVDRHRRDDAGDGRDPGGDVTGTWDDRTPDGEDGTPDRRDDAPDRG